MKKRISLNLKDIWVYVITMYLFFQAASFTVAFYFVNSLADNPSVVVIGTVLVWYIVWKSIFLEFLSALCVVKAAKVLNRNNVNWGEVLKRGITITIPNSNQRLDIPEHKSADIAEAMSRLLEKEIG